MIDNRSGHARTRVLRWSLYASAPVLAVLTSWLATRNRASAEDASSRQRRAADAPTIAQPVMLTADQAQRIGVTYAIATVVPLGREIRTVGQVTYDETRVKAVSLKIDGWIEQLYVNFTGQAVTAGTPLLALYSPMLVTAQEELLLAKRLQSDVAAGAADARANAASLLQSARSRLDYWDVSPAVVQRIESTGHVQRAITLRAPVSGFVVEKNVLEGQRVMAGDPLYRIADLGTVWIEGEVFERDLASVRLGQVVSAQFDALSGRAWTGHIAYINPTVDPDTRTVRVRVALANPKLQLKPGMYATLVWTGVSAPVLTVPRTAVVETGQRNLVFVRRSDGMLEPRIVDVGVSTADRIEIRRGLEVGETVVQSATFLVDAESNLSTVLGGMGDMPGMDMTSPRQEPSRAGANH